MLSSSRRCNRVLSRPLMPHVRGQALSQGHTYLRTSLYTTTHFRRVCYRWCTFATSAASSVRLAGFLLPAPCGLRHNHHGLIASLRTNSGCLVRSATALHLSRRVCCSSLGHDPSNGTDTNNDNNIHDSVNDYADVMDEDELVEYEALLLNAQSSHDTYTQELSHNTMGDSAVPDDMSLSAAATTTTTCAERTDTESTMHASSTRVDDIIAQLLTFLPLDGTAVRLTTLTPHLDVEAISELFGSLLSFLQIFPAHFDCRCEDASPSTATNAPSARATTAASHARPSLPVRRWYVARRVTSHGDADVTGVSTTLTTPVSKHTHELCENHTSRPAVSVQLVRESATKDRRSADTHTDGIAMASLSDYFAEETLREICGWGATKTDTSGNDGSAIADDRRMASAPLFHCMSSHTEDTNRKPSITCKPPRRRRRLQPAHTAGAAAVLASFPPWRVNKSAADTDDPAKVVHDAGPCDPYVEPVHRQRDDPEMSECAANDSAEAAAQWWAVLAQSQLPPHHSITTAQLRERLPAEARAALRSAGCGFTRFWKHWHPIASRYVEWSYDGVRVARRGVLASEGVARWGDVCVSAATETRLEIGGSAPFLHDDDDDNKMFVETGKDVDVHGYSTLPWHVELNLEDDEGEEVVQTGVDKEEVAEVCAYDRQDADTLDARDEVVMSEVPMGAERSERYGGGGRLPELNWSRIAQAPPAPAAVRPSPNRAQHDHAWTQAGVSDRSCKTAMKRRKADVLSSRCEMSDDETVLAHTHRGRKDERGEGDGPVKRVLGDDALLAAHTTLALSRGKYPPADLLPLFVECVPSFYVPRRALIISDQLAKIFGPHTGMDVLTRIYRYYFDHDEATQSVRVRSQAAMQANHVSADRYYSSWRPTTTTPPADRSCSERTGSSDADHTSNSNNSKSEHDAESTQSNQTLFSTTTRTTTASPSRLIHSATTCHTSSSSKLLLPSAKTSAFPVLRPTIISRVKLPRTPRLAHAAPAVSVVSDGERPSDTRRHVDQTAHTPLTENEGDGVPTAPLRTRDGPPPVRAAASRLNYPFDEEDVMQWPLYARAACALPSTHFVSMRKAAEVCGVSVSDMHAVADAESPAQVAHAAFLVRHISASDREAGEIRVRPYWVSPHYTGEEEEGGGGLAKAARATAEEWAGVCKRDVLRHIRPTWTTMSKLWTRLSPDSRAYLTRRLASETDGLPHGNVWHASCPSPPPTPPGLADYVRGIDETVWVSTCGTRVRRYTGCADLDDLTHLCLPLLRRCSSHQWTTWSEVTARAKRLSQQIQQAQGQRDGCESSMGLALQLTHTPNSGVDSPPAGIALVHFLRAHDKYIDITVNANSCVTHIRRRTHYT